MKHHKTKINCYFSTQKCFTCRSLYSVGGKIKHGKAWQCYYCSNYYGAKGKYDRQIQYCNGKPGFIYNFDTKNFVTFEENLKNKGNLPFLGYCDFESTAPTDSYLDPKNEEIFAISYVIIFAFHPDLNFD